MKTRLLAAVAMIAVLPTMAQANSAMTEKAFARQHEALNTQVTTEYQLLPSTYRFDTVGGGHSTAEGASLSFVNAVTQRATNIDGGSPALVGGGQSDAAAKALERVNGGAGPVAGHVEMSFASTR
ncbi:hypothetical protein [Salinicola avicenniae]|uniref:hypothetical protein n=1 Tax=Salinicola avicenniae TaxID=2916836 RepID=UPI0020737CB4|nr:MULTISPECIES: hypothetical protein [unclassified Salinicola]